MSPRFEVGDRVGHVRCPGTFFVSSRKVYSGGCWLYNLRVSMKDEPPEKYWVFEVGLDDDGVICEGKLTEEAYGICDCFEDNLYPFTGSQTWDSETV